MRSSGLRVKAFPKFTGPVDLACCFAIEPQSSFKQAV